MSIAILQIILFMFLLCLQISAGHANYNVFRVYVEKSYFYAEMLARSELICKLAYEEKWCNIFYVVRMEKGQPSPLYPQRTFLKEWFLCVRGRSAQPFRVHKNNLTKVRGVMSKEIGKEKVIQIRVSQQQADDYKQLAELNGMSLSNYIRQHFSEMLRIQKTSNLKIEADALPQLSNQNVFALRRDLSFVGSRLNDLCVVASKNGGNIKEVEQQLKDAIGLTVKTLQKLAQ
ncbi:hypothetical protein [Ochrobactrum sp. EDr1-4]|uniref:hypothetical protein n=1 Tax=Ochrobactrum sp. EDr1-4 TaxID=3368622 RepID=UPI003BA23472